MEITQRVTNAEEVSKLHKFKKFMKSVVKKFFPEDVPDWIKRFVDSAYEKGVNKAYHKTRKTALLKDKGKDGLLEFKKSFNTSNDLEKARLLYESTYDRLKDLGDYSAKKATRIITEGFITRKSPVEVARELRDATKIEFIRAKTIVNTEIVRVHAEGALDALEKLGVVDIEVEVEWSTAGDGKVCPLCKPLQGLVIPLKKARGMFPRHPNCRCSPIPSFQKVDKGLLRRSVSSSIDAERPKTIKRSFKQQKEMSRWQGKRLISQS